MQEPTLRLRVVFPDGAMLGPGKADLLVEIARTGSISAAGRALGMSYKRAWMLVDTMNRAFATPLVQSARGGARGGGATLTETGQAVLTHYRALERAAANAGEPQIEALSNLRQAGDMSGGK